MITATVPTQRPKLAWQDVIKTKEDYESLSKSGLMYVYFPDISWKEVEDYLNKEKQVVTD